MAGQTRDLLPWEARCGCPTCRVKPGQLCITLATRYPARAKAYPKMIGRPTHHHKARYQLWCYLWGRTSCTNNIPSIPIGRTNA